MQDGPVEVRVDVCSRAGECVRVRESGMPCERVCECAMRVDVLICVFVASCLSPARQSLHMELHSLCFLDLISLRPLK